MIALLVMTDGRRDCITEAIPSAVANLRGPISRRFIHDDSGDPDYRAWLRERFPEFELIPSSGRRGFGGAIRNAWHHLRGFPEPYVFHAEDDFVYRRQVDLDDMMAVLELHPDLVQLALRRQPWNDDERRAGGIVEQHPDDYVDRGQFLPRPRTSRKPMHVGWLEHRRFFTTNPSLYRSALMDVGWPDCPASEGHFTHRLLEDPAVRFGFWGHRESGEWVEHIGHERAGVGY